MNICYAFVGRHTDFEPQSSKIWSPKRTSYSRPSTLLLFYYILNSIIEICFSLVYKNYLPNILDFAFWPEKPKTFAIRIFINKKKKFADLCVSTFRVNSYPRIWGSRTCLTFPQSLYSLTLDPNLYFHWSIYYSTFLPVFFVLFSFPECLSLDT